MSAQGKTSTAIRILPAKYHGTPDHSQAAIVQSLMSAMQL
jgi:hypothetical protein